MRRFGRALWYRSSAYGTTVFNPSLPPDICTTTRILPSGCVAFSAAAFASGFAS